MNWMAASIAAIDAEWVEGAEVAGNHIAMLRGRRHCRDGELRVAFPELSMPSLSRKVSLNFLWIPQKVEAI